MYRLDLWAPGVLYWCLPWQPFYFGGGGAPPPPVIIPPPPPPPPPMPDIGSQQALEAQREKLATQLRTGRTSTDLAGANDELRGGRSGLGGADPNAPATPAVGNPTAPLYTGQLLGGITKQP